MLNETKIPELAGLASYAEAARIGYSVDESVRRLLRYHWTGRRLMSALLAHLPSEPVWEVKCAMALHQWQLAGLTDAIRTRIGEMRHPVPPLDRAPDADLDRFLDEVLRSTDTVELIGGTYDVALRGLALACRSHLAASNPLVDHPTRRVLRTALIELDEALAWGDSALIALTEFDAGAADRAAEWKDHLEAYLRAAGDIAGPSPDPAPPLPSARARKSFQPDLRPRRDERFSGLDQFDFPPHVLYNDPRVPADERNIALLAKRTLEMDVPEMMASIMVERTDQPWEFHLDFSRQLWDEARHAMMGTVAFEAREVDWTRIPLNIGFSLRLNLHATALERQILLYAIEQSLMPADTGKRLEYETALAAGDALSAHFHDYDWADEVLHAQIGRRWLRHEGISQEEAQDRAAPIHERTWAALQAYRAGVEREWWSDFVQSVLGRPSALRPNERSDLRIIAE
ncbi:MAG TPA: hypothetical protein VJU15_05070 [Gemmatimonadales bacterium]|nr:hypothetical protein [Gemmatimonadales bacterium]